MKQRRKCFCLQTFYIIVYNFGIMVPVDFNDFGLYVIGSSHGTPTVIKSDDISRNNRPASRLCSFSKQETKTVYGFILDACI